MSPIFRGTTEVVDCFRGSVAVSAIYRGTALVWAKANLVGFQDATVDINASIRSYKTTTHSSGAKTVTAETVTRPINVAAGDLLVLYTIADSGTTGDYVVPSGFTELGRVIGSPGARHVVSYKVATASEPTTYTYARYSAASDGVSLLACVRDWNGSTANLSFIIDSNAAATGTFTPSVTPKTARNLLMTSIATDDDSAARVWGWIPPNGAAAVGYAHNAGGWSSGSVSHEVWNSSSATGQRAWGVNTASTQTTKFKSALTIGSGTSTKTITEFLSDYSGGSGGAKTNTTDNSFTDSAGVSSVYHLFAAGLDWTKNVGLLIYTDGSDEYGLKTPQITSQSPYLLYGATGMIEVAKKHNMVLLTPRAPGAGCDDGDGECWYDHSSTSNTSPWTKLEWSNELIRKVLKEYNIDRRRIAIGGYSSGAQWCTAWWGPKYGSEIMKDGVCVAISYGGQPRATPNISADYKSNVQHVWDVGDQDTSYTQPMWDDGVQTGRKWYQDAGFAVTDLVLVAGKTHDRYNATTMVGEFGPIMDREITTRVTPA